MPRKPSPRTPEEKAAIAAYMRDYRARRGHREYGRSLELAPTDRQVQILALYADPSVGGTYRAVANVLDISESSVRTQVGHLMARLGVHNPVQAFARLAADGHPGLQRVLARRTDPRQDGRIRDDVSCSTLAGLSS